MNLAENRRKIFEKCAAVNVCAVTKQHSIAEVDSLLTDLPGLKIIGENRWPDCEEKFKYFAGKVERHFIGPLQSNKVRKVLPLVECIQSVDSIKLMQRIDEVAGELGKTVDFLIQVNVSRDKAKSGVMPEEVAEMAKMAGDLKNARLKGLMTIGARKGQRGYFAELKSLFDQLGLKVLSMGMSDGFEVAIEQGATMVRLGSCLF